MLERQGGTPWTTRPDIGARLLILQGLIILDMFHSGQITPDEAGAMYNFLFDQTRLTQEIEDYIKHNGVLSIDSQTSRLNMLSMRMAPTEQPKP